ncbi:Hypothetical protein R9X50_00038400 [Acrodontium crateriforme]|uniref:Rhodanese domain-containing protein n=1 Tax=Acrodontium crateriforme TaxID=150365 RepID=A0AAQ3R1Z9_9PEZI|nr:Hypothetical protein R9X50_00038400 [Acrodontium crateriforme]
MAATRRLAFSALSSAVARSSARAPVSRLASYAVTRPQPRQPATSPLALGAVRWHSTPASASKVYNFDEVKKISESLDGERVLIDVREPTELEGGYIPTAINIPIKSQPDALFLPEEEFVDRFGFSKPATDKEVIFYCKSGVRSSAAAQLAQQCGYKNVAEYRGSWMDWQKQGGVASGPWAA